MIILSTNVKSCVKKNEGEIFFLQKYPYPCEFAAGLWFAEYHVQIFGSAQKKYYINNKEVISF